MGILFTALYEQSTYADGDYVLSYDVSAGGARRTYFSGLYSYICTKLASGTLSGINFAGSIKATTGDPTGAEGLLTINTYDNAIKIYADGAWRTLASW